MKLDHLELKGLFTFNDACAIDLRELPPGLIAVIGENGAGKTGFLESAFAALYRTFPSRADRELVDYATGRDSYLDASFALDGQGILRARVNLDGLRRNSEAVLTQTTEAGTVPLNDGKVSTFDAAVARTFPPAALMLASAFSAQNRNGSFATLDRKGRKTLFAQLLGLDHYETLAQTARTAAGLIDQTRTRVHATREAVSRTATMEQELEILTRQTAIAGSLAYERQEHDQAGEVIAATEIALEAARVQAAAYQAATLRRDTARVDVMRAERALVDADSETRTATANGDRDRQGLQGQLASTLRDLDARAANNQQVLDQAEVIRLAVTRLARCEDRLALLRAVEAGSLEDLTTIQSRRRDLEARLREAAQAGRDLARVREQAGLVSTVPCAGEGAYGACRFLASARQAGLQIPDLERASGAVADLTADLDRESEAEAMAQETLKQTRSSLQECEAERTRMLPTARLAEPLAVAEARLAELARQRETSQAEHQDRTRDLEARLAARLETLAETRTKAELARQEARDAQISAEAACAATAPAAQDVAAYTAQLARARATWDATTTTIARLEAEAGELARRLDAIAIARVELADLDARLTTIETAWLDWTWLAKALGRDGLPILEIDAAGPTVSRLCNQLLEASFGARFSVDLVTQEAKADGKGLKESFELKVIDGLRGGDPRDLSDLSGGEQVIVEEALKNALALYANSRSQTPTRTCWRDETTGALDGENASRYLAMLRSMREIGGLHHILYVTHNRDAARLADAQILIHDGQADLLLPPFADAA